MPRRRGLQEDGDGEDGAYSLTTSSPSAAASCGQPQASDSTRTVESTPYYSEDAFQSNEASYIQDLPQADVQVAESNNHVNDSTGGVTTLEAMTRDDIEAQIRKRLQKEIESDAVTAVVIQEEDPPFWTKRRLLIALVGISLLAIVAVSVGVVIATRSNKETYLEGSATIMGMSDSDRFAESIALSRDASTLAAVARDGHYVQVFRRNGVGSWAQVGQSILYEYDVDNKFPGKVEFNRNGSILVVARWNSEDSAQNLRVGMAQAYKYNQDTNVWEELAQPLLGSAQDDHLGYSIALSDDGNGKVTLAVGSRQGDPGGLNEAGYCRVFTLNSEGSGGQWIQVGSDIEGTKAREQFGVSLALTDDGRRVAVGAIGGTTRKGVVRVYDFDGSWNQVGQSIEGDIEKADANIVAMSRNGTTLVIAANGEEEKDGYKRTFLLEGCCSWKQAGPDLVGKSRNIALSSDASCLLVGQPDSNDKKGGGELFRWNTHDLQWKQIAVTRGDTVGDELGESVAVSGNCSTFALGANQKSIAEHPAGYVRVYQVDAR